ncbi:MAG: hypothetical protein EI684_22600 [Candidatus Viridilinea halotolerans]|uniref:Uncharacterized protein n=1 Tax=Candidatus Viridilinea halotolerans TaxID=2491704 RepID=A0A426TQN7_9CHLR|nr:MAG: hypothetical protein EI684_22600 [Candidatus Viridilinea halotolerans]
MVNPCVRKREAGSGKREVGSGKREAGSGKREVGSGGTAGIPLTLSQAGSWTDRTFARQATDR